MFKFFTAAIISAAIILPAQAGTHDRGVNKRQHHQHARIANGVKSGELSKDEAQNLRADQKSLRQKERAYKADGQLTKEERIDMRKDVHANSKEIYSEKHD